MVTNEEIYAELRKVRELIEHSLRLQIKIAEEASKIESFEGEQAESEKRIAQGVRAKKFATITDWKIAIWDNCEHKVENVGAQDISFTCAAMKGPCRFEKCPKNFVE